MKKLLILPVLMLLQSCATMVSFTVWPVTVDSSPSQAGIIIKDRVDSVIYRGTTPAKVNLRSGDGYFKRGIYTVIFTNEGFTTDSIQIKSRLNGWYFGNIVFGLVPGMLGVDPATGAMYKIKDPKINIPLKQSTSFEQKSIPQNLNLKDELVRN